MRLHELCDDVAVFREVGRCVETQCRIELRREVRHVSASLAIELTGVRAISRDDVAHVSDVAMRAGDEPAAEAILQRRLVPGDERWRRAGLRAGRRLVNGSQAY